MAAGRSWVVACAVLLAAVMVAYLPVWQAGWFAWDDVDYVPGNRIVRSGLTLDGVRWALVEGSHAANWHPLTWLSHMADTSIFGPLPGPAHVVNAVLHGLAALLLFLVLAVMTGHPAPAFFTALLFAIHPVQVEAVAWVAQRKTILATLGALSSLGAYLWHLRKPGRGRFAVVLLLTWASYLCKATAVVIPLLMAAADFWPFGRRLSRRWLAEKLLLFAPIPLVIHLSWRAQAAWGAVEDFPLRWRLANALVAPWQYVAASLWPVRLSVYHPHPHDGVPLVLVMAAATGLLTITAFLFATRHRWPHLAAGGIWFLAGLAPILGLVQLGWQGWAERYLHLPVIGLLMALMWTLRGTKAGILLPVAAASILLPATMKQASLWTDSASVFRQAWRNTGAAWAGINLGKALQETGRDDEAAAVYQEILRLDPSNPYAHYNVGNLLAARGAGDEAAAHFRQAISIKADYAEAYANLGVLLFESGDPAGALTCFETVARISPGRSSSWVNLGSARAALGNLDGAGEAYRRAVSLDPGNPEALNGWGNVLSAGGRTREAAEAYRQALSADPSHARARRNLQRLDSAR